METFLAFGWGDHTHDCIGGWAHYVGKGNNLEEGRLALLEAIADNEGMSDEINYGHVVNIETGKIEYTWNKYNGEIII